MLYFEDFREGDSRVFGDMLVTKDAILDFAQRFDPQPMHLDEDAAKTSLLGGLAASGWHSCAMLMRMMCDDFLLDSSSMGSPGIEENHWQAPVYPGDKLHARRQVLETKPSRSKPDRGVVRFRFELYNQDDKRILWMICPIMFGKREAAA